MGRGGLNSTEPFGENGATRGLCRKNSPRKI
nr:MAG TPA: hypothetical protein [Myoviridae sp. ctLGX4]